MRDLVAAIQAYARAAHDLDKGLVLDTEASREIADERRLAWRALSEPVGGAHSAVRLGHFFTIDALHSLALLVGAEPPSVYGPFVVARSLLDAGGRSYWLSEPGIGADLRVQRSMVLALAEGARQQIPTRSELQSSRDAIERRRGEIEASCRHHGWAFGSAQAGSKGGKKRESASRVGNQYLPRTPRLIHDLLGGEESEAERGLGATLWWALCGYTHGSMDSLLAAVVPNPDGDLSTPNAVIEVDYARFVWLLTASGRAAQRLTDRRVRLMGGSTEELVRSGTEMSRQLDRYGSAARNRTLPEGYRPTPPG